MSETSEYLLVVDTEDYSGNFERPMCAWITGQVGECGVGSRVAEVAEKDLPEEVFEWCQEHVVSKPDDDNGCRRPVAIRPTPGWFNNGRGGHFRRDDPKAAEKAQEHWDAGCETDAEHSRKVYAHMPDYAETEAQRKLAEKGKPFWDCPAYQSIEIYLDVLPSPEMFQLFKDRAMAFSKDRPNKQSWDGEITVTNVRLLKQTTTTTEEDMA